MTEKIHETFIQDVGLLVQVSYLDLPFEKQER
jgi:hypothetical protein